MQREKRAGNCRRATYVFQEVAANMHRVPAEAAVEWPILAERLVVMRDLTSFEYAAVFTPGRDRPILFTAAGWADVLLTWDRQHFGPFFESGFYCCVFRRLVLSSPLIGSLVGISAMSSSRHADLKLGARVSPPYRLI